MTRYWRDGFYRTSVLGNIHWVEGHEVDRFEWESAALTRRDDKALHLVRAQAGGFARLVRPNADCPVCGRPVFFYQNSFGSRVFFDELGPPWPKHPCTMPAAAHQAAATVITVSADRLRSQEQFDAIERWSADNLDRVFTERYGAPPWHLAIFVGIYESHGTEFLAIRSGTSYRYFALRSTDRACLVDGQLLTYSGNELSYVSHVDLSVQQLKLRPVSANRALLHIFKLERLDDASNKSA
jgi:hypothetical protein